MDPFRPAFVKNLNIEIVQGQDWAMGLRALPRNAITGQLYLEDTTGYTALMMVRDGGPDGDVVLEASTANGRIQVGYTPRKWQASMVYGVGQQVVPPTLNGYLYQVTVGGTSGGSQPTWPTVIGNTVVNGTVTFQAVASDAKVSNIYIHLPAAVTAGLADWGFGSWQLEVTDTFAHTWLYIDGVARLRKESAYA